jgi:hypothetical protein
MQTVYIIVWRNPQTGNTVHVGLSDYSTWKEADAALTTLLRYRTSNLTPTIEERKLI